MAFWILYITDSFCQIKYIQKNFKFKNKFKFLNVKNIDIFTTDAKSMVGKADGVLQESR